MNRVIVESPYAAAEGRSVQEHTLYARRCVRHSLDWGEAPFASHLFYTQPNILDDTNPTERERGLQSGYEWMEAADFVAFYIDLGWSPGMLKALKVARMLGKKVELRHVSMLSHLEVESD